jgi:hypothetical protein
MVGRSKKRLVDQVADILSHKASSDFLVWELRYNTTVLTRLLSSIQSVGVVETSEVSL